MYNILKSIYTYINIILYTKLCFKVLLYHMYCIQFGVFRHETKCVFTRIFSFLQKFIMCSKPTVYTLLHLPPVFLAGNTILYAYIHCANCTLHGANSITCVSTAKCSPLHQCSDQEALQGSTAVLFKRVVFSSQFTTAYIQRLPSFFASSVKSGLL